MNGAALLSDDIVSLLRVFPNDALRGVVSICKRHTSWSVFPADRAYEAHQLTEGADFATHADAIAREILWWGSHDFGRQVGMLPAWRDIVVAVARQAGVEDEHRATTLPVWKIEQATLRKALTDWERLSLEQREEILKKAGIDISAARGAATAAAGGLVRLGGEQLLAFLAARGAGYALAATIFAPVVAVLGAVWTAHDLAGPSQRVLRPVVLTIATNSAEASRDTNCGSFSGLT